MTKIRKINILTFAKLQAVILGIVGVIAGALYSIGGLAVDTFVSLGWVSSVAASTPGLSVGTLLALGALVGMPVIFAAVGFIAGIVEASVFNLFAKWLDGVEINLER